MYLKLKINKSMKDQQTIYFPSFIFLSFFHDHLYMTTQSFPWDIPTEEN